jgi:hypothetical protein
MAQFAILLTGAEARPTIVRLVEDDSRLTLVAGDGTQSHIPWWHLFRISDEGSTDCFKRLDKRHWELRVTAGADRELLARVGRKPLARMLHPLRRLQSAKTFVGMFVLLVAVAQHFPAEWTARAVTPALQDRLVDFTVAQDATKRCSHPGGEDAVRKLLVQLDPRLGPTVRIVALDEGGFDVTAAPANTLVVTRGSLQDTDPETMAALLAHQLAHLRHGDAVVAMVRHEGLWGLAGGVLEGHLSNGIKMEYSGLEEQRADLEAIAMLRNAHIAITPAARLFEDIRVSRAQGTYLAYEYRDFHFGVAERSKRWAEASAAQRQQDWVRRPLSRDESDALFNFCWAGQLPPAPQSGRPPAPRSEQPGFGAVSSA